MVDLQINVASFEGNVTYVDPGLTEYWDSRGPFYCASGRAERFRTIIGIYSSTLFLPDIGTQYNKPSTQYDKVVSLLGGPQRAGRELAMDVWGNVRVPTLHRLRGYNPGNASRWVDVPLDEEVQDYYSLIGLIYRGIPPTFEGNMTMLVNQNYHKFSVSKTHPISENGADNRSLVFALDCRVPEQG